MLPLRSELFDGSDRAGSTQRLVAMIGGDGVVLTMLLR